MVHIHCSSEKNNKKIHSRFFFTVNFYLLLFFTHLAILLRLFLWNNLFSDLMLATSFLMFLPSGK